jgi:hypothetical protein
MSYEEWLKASNGNDEGAVRQNLVAAVVSGDIPNQGRNAEVIQQTVHNSTDDLQAGMAALARSRMTRIADTMTFVDHVERQLMSRVNLGEASLDQLLGCARFLRTSVRDDVNLVQNTISLANSKSAGLNGSQFNFNIGDQILNLGDEAAKSALNNRDSRDRSRTVLDSLISAARRNFNGNSTEQSES